ncbi:nucleoside permease [Lysobacter claricitrinus]|uniref:nucleoside permease n=1 Tax=Lysobacter claricitrinus TaxID=3367728 RepID=UPI0037DA8312
MNLKLRLTLMNFLQFFVWGAWLLTVGAYWFQNRQWSGTSFGQIFSTMGISALFMPSLMGIVADRWINAERLYGALHILGGVFLCMLPRAANPDQFYALILATMLCYMPTISLAIAVAYNALKGEGLDVVRDYPPIRVWGTVGFIAATWTTSWLGFESSANQFYVAAAGSVLLGLYAFTLPAAPPRLGRGDSRSLVDALGLTSFRLFRDRNMAVFFIFAMLLGAALQLTNAYGVTFLKDFESLPQFKDAFGVRHAAVIVSISQISETLFILTIPFFLKRFGIKTVMTISMIAWFLRFGLFAYGDPGPGLWMIVLSCVVYGMAFDFFNISGSLFVEQQSDPRIRASAQGLFMLMTNGVGAVLGSRISGWMIDRFFTGANGAKDWHGIWTTFALYSLAMAILFVPLFRHRHNAAAVSVPGHGAADVTNP